MKIPSGIVNYAYQVGESESTWIQSAFKDYAALKTYDTESMGSIYLTKDMWKLMSAYVEVSKYGPWETITLNITFFKPICHVPFMGDHDIEYSTLISFRHFCYIFDI